MPKREFCLVVKAKKKIHVLNPYYHLIIRHLVVRRQNLIILQHLLIKKSINWIKLKQCCHLQEIFMDINWIKLKYCYYYILQEKKF